MKVYVSKKRREVEKELLNYLRNYRFYACRFEHIEVLDKLIDDIVNELKEDL